MELMLYLAIVQTTAARDCKVCATLNRLKDAMTDVHWSNAWFDVWKMPITLLHNPHYWSNVWISPMPSA